MEPVEINAGTWYLRQLRADDRIDDRAALVDAAATTALPGARIPDVAAATSYIDTRARQWHHDERYSWAIADVTTGVLVGEVTLAHIDADAGTADLTCWVDARRAAEETETTAVNAVIRFAQGALGLSDVSVRQAR